MSRGLTYLSMLSPTILNVFKCEAATDFSGPNRSQELELICDERDYSGGRGLLVDDPLSESSLSWSDFALLLLPSFPSLPAHQPVLIPGLHLSPPVLN